MICSVCGAYIEDDSTFCTECGTPVTVYENTYSQDYITMTEPEPKSFGVRKIAIITVLSVLVISLIGIILYFNSDLHHYRKNYKAGNESFTDKKYEDALKHHKEAIKYKETDEVKGAICEDYLQIAEGHLKKDNYAKAVKSHKEMRKYGKEPKEINELLAKDYELWGNYYLDEGDFEDAIETHLEMGDYGGSKEDVDELVAEDYEAWADSYLKEDNPMEAIKIVYRGIDETSHDALWQKAEEIKERTVILKAERFRAEQIVEEEMVKEGVKSPENLWGKEDEVLERVKKEGEDLGYNIYEYDESNRLTKVVVYSSDDVKDGEYIYTYDKKGQLIEKYSFFDGHTEFYWTYDYNERAELIHTYCDSGFEEEYTYDKDGKLTQSISTIFGDHPRLTTYAYDEKNRLITESSVPLYEGGESKNTSLKIYKYDDYGNMKQKESDSEYWIYDIFGNVIINGDVTIYTYHYIENKKVEKQE